MRGYLRTFVLFAVFTALVIGLGQIWAAYSGTDRNTALIGFALISILINTIMYFASAKMVLWSTRAKIVSQADAPRLHRIVDRVVLRAGIPKPKVAIMPTRTPNAFATGRNPKHAVVAATVGIMEMLDDDELEGVIAHEISHVKNRDILIMSVASAMASIISWVAFSFLWGGRDRNANPLVGILIWLLAPIAAMLIQLAISRSREYAADASGAHLLGHGESLAKALMKMEAGVAMRPLQTGNPSTSSMFIVNPFRSGGMTGLFRTHPPTADRVRRLRELQF